MAGNSRSTDPLRIFNGTWRPTYGPPGPEEQPDVRSLEAGVFECRSCEPPYRVPADGRDHVVEGHPRFETLAVTVVDDRTVRLVGRRGGATSYGATIVVAADGNTVTETRTAAMLVGNVVVPIMTPMTGDTVGGRRPVLFRLSAVRIGSPMPAAHLVSGTWRTVDLDLVNHDEDTTYHVADGRLTMSDRLGRSFTAALDGTVAPYLGDPRFNRVAIRTIDERTIEESNLDGDSVVQVTRWQVDPDGTTMHVRFDDTRGHVLEQTGRRLP